MPKNRVSTLDRQVFNHKQPYEASIAYKAALAKLIQEKSFELDRQATESDIPYQQIIELRSQYRNAFNWDWNEEWDTDLINTMYALEKVGFYVINFTRSRKIRLSGNSGLTQVELFTKIHECTGDLANIKFTHGGIWIQLAKPKPIKQTSSIKNIITFTIV